MDIHCAKWIIQQEDVSIRVHSPGNGKGTIVGLELRFTYETKSTNEPKQYCLVTVSYCMLISFKLKTQCLVTVWSHLTLPGLSLPAVLH